MMVRAWVVAALAIVGVSSTGCAASARFYSKTGAELAPIATRAVVCDQDSEVRAVQAAGGVPIGNVSGKGITVQSTDDDVIAKAAVVAAKSGGTHVFRTELGEETFYVNHPAERRRTCSEGQNTEDCTTTWTPPSTSTYSEPTARFVVFRVPRADWAKLPETLRPAPRE